MLVINCQTKDNLLKDYNAVFLLSIFNRKYTRRAYFKEQSNLSVFDIFLAKI